MEALVNYQQQPQFRGSVVKEYLLVINPEADVWQRVMDEKTGFFNRYREMVALKTKPHITIANFLAKEEMEETIIRWTHRVISTKKVFRVALNNYGGFPNANTIYVRVQDPQPFRQLAKELKVIGDLVKDNGLPKAHLVSNPHMTIARNISPLIYREAMMEYAKKDFHAEFEVKELVLLKRMHQFESCQQVNIFRLQP
jgi:2'-5' RNA ligase